MSSSVVLHSSFVCGVPWLLVRTVLLVVPCLGRFLTGGCVFSFLLDLLLSQESIVGRSPSPLFDCCLVRLFFVEVRRVVERACLGNLASASEVARVASHSSHPVAIFCFVLPACGRSSQHGRRAPFRRHEYAKDR